MIAIEVLEKIDTVTLLAFFGVAYLLLLIPFVFRNGVLRGGLAWLLRGVWLAPLLMALFPVNEVEPLPKSISNSPLHVFIDDSHGLSTEATKNYMSSLLQKLEQKCEKFSCQIYPTAISSLSSQVKEGFSPLATALEDWFLKVGRNPYVVITDGADWQPENAWPSSIRKATNTDSHGLVVGVGAKDLANTWIETADIPPFMFEEKPISIELQIRRQVNAASIVQVQVTDRDEPIFSTNANFGNSQTVGLNVTIPPLERGIHLLKIKVLPTPSEKVLWDNDLLANIEVLPNTMGVLHLLGAPSWDGRFFRRFLKSEPKFDIISFFILRDPWDDQTVSERELSLIPFPVERLFNEELASFRVIVLQNFKLFQFLEPSYQENLVKFVKAGGGLLFIGGERALLSADISNTPLREILPFESIGGVKANDNMRFSRWFEKSVVDKSGPYYDEDQQFKISFAQPSLEKRALAGVYDEWLNLKKPLSSWGGAKGLHHMENVRFKKDQITHLLDADINGKKTPLAVASYPGKGRALWLFTDSMWKMALSSQGDVTRNIYNNFFQSSMSWLMRQDNKRPIVITNLNLYGEVRSDSKFEMTIKGPAAKYFTLSKNWSVKVCDIEIPNKNIDAKRFGADGWILSGSILGKRTQDICKARITGRHSAFGSVQAEIFASFARVYNDSQLAASDKKLRRLSEHLSAKYFWNDDLTEYELNTWMKDAVRENSDVSPTKFKSTANHFWHLDKNWIWMLLLALPLEVLLRRWEHFVGNRIFKQKQKMTLRKDRM